ncbi:MAG: tyrosine-type recombinase/integrase [Dechloromonas sp.]|nr:tyrosine-type recombinase/integrase [Dechloromonas sp.]
MPTLNLSLPRELDGSAGSNRAKIESTVISARNDLQAIVAWLARFTDTKTTFDNYRKEAERLLLWSIVELRKPLSSLTHEDLLVYQRFLADPQPASRWIFLNGRKPARQDARWRPFAGPLAATSQRQALVILNAMFSWLVNAGYLAGNPLSLSRQRSRRAKPRVTRYLDDDLWQAVKATIAALPRETEREREHYARARWTFSLLYGCGLRISEIASNTMGGFFCRKDAQYEDRWWLEIVGKGDKVRIIPITNELLAELIRYRREYGLAPLPVPGDTTPLVLTIAGKPKPLTRSALHGIIKRVFQATAETTALRGEDMAHQVERLRRASAHWLRHTAGSRMADAQMDLRHVRDNLGHESLTTTSVYLHSSDDARHRETEEKHRLDW